MRKILYILSVALMLAGCEKYIEVYEYTTPIEPKADYKVSVSTDSDSDTKVDIDGTVIKWSENDYIYIAEIGEDDKFSQLFYFKIDSESISEDGKSADFYGETLEVGKQYLAVKSNYTWINDDTQSNQQLGIDGSLAISGGWNQYQSQDSSDYHVEASWSMLSPAFEVSQNSTTQINFSNLSSYLELNLMMEEDVVDEYEISSVTFTSTSQMFIYNLYLNTSSQVVYSYPASSLTLTLEDNPTISSAKDYTAYIPFLLNENITVVNGDFTITITTSDSKETSVTVPAKVLTESKLYTKDLVFPAPEDMVASDRATLMAFYYATGGDNWTNNENWCTDAPLSEWYGVRVNSSSGRVTSLSTSNNNLNGYIPESIGNLSNLTWLSLHEEGITGSIPESIGDLINLSSLYVYCENLSGSIPESIGNLTNLTYMLIFGRSITGTIPSTIGNLTNLEHLYISGVDYSGTTGLGKMSGEIPDIFGSMNKLMVLMITSAQFSGSIPSSLGTLTNLTTLNLSYNQLEGSISCLSGLTSLESLYISYNKLSGAIPNEFGNFSNWSEMAWGLISTQQSGYGFTSFPDVYLEPSTITTIENKTINTKEFFANNDITCVVLWRSWCWWSTYYMSTIKDLYSSYGGKGFGLISLNDESDLSTISTYVSENSIPGEVCQLSGWDYSDGTNRIKYMPTSSSPTYAFVDSEGKVIFSESLYEFADPTMSREQATIAFLEENFGEPSVSTGVYESSDYSKDGEVLTLQTATVGSGINIVIVGDGFVDTDMESGGAYETRM
ncbi:MAG: leucine-rich repeat domain-containing protein, partial [Rikenellaceae bacterium]